MARRILGLTRLSAVFSWRLGLTHAKLEESTSCIPSCYGPSWRLQSRLLKCNGLTTYRNFRAQGLSDTTWMPWMHWYRAAQAAIGEELWITNITTCHKMMYCKLQMLFTIVYCSEPTKRIQAILEYSLPKTLSPGVASGILVTSCSLAALITQATATASLSCRNASCGFRSVAEPLDWEIQRRLWGVLGIFTAQLTFQKQGAWSCHHKSYKSVRACKCN